MCFNKARKNNLRTRRWKIVQTFSGTSLRRSQTRWETTNQVPTRNKEAIEAVQTLLRPICHQYNLESAERLEVTPRTGGRTLRKVHNWSEVGETRRGSEGSGRWCEDAVKGLDGLVNDWNVAVLHLYGAKVLHSRPTVTMCCFGRKMRFHCFAQGHLS